MPIEDEIQRLEEEIFRAKYAKKRVDAMTTLSKKLINTGLPFRAFDYAQKAYELAGKKNYIQGIARSSLHLGTIYFAKERYDESRRFMQEAARCFAQSDNKAGESNAHSTLGLCALRLGDYETAFREKMLALDCAIASGKPELVADSGISLANLYYRAGNIALATRYAKEAVANAESSGSDIYQERVFGEFGVFQMSLGNIAEASEFFKRALQAAERIGNINSQGILLTHLAKLEGIQGNFAQKDEYLHRALAIFQESNNHYGCVKIYKNLGFTQFQLGNFHQSLALFHQALHLSENKKVPELHLSIMKALASTYSRLGDFEKALHLFEQANSLLLQVKNLQENVQLWIEWAQCYEDCGLPEKAELLYRQASEIAQSSGFTPLLSIISERLSLFFERRNDMVNALHFAEKHWHLELSMNNDEQRSRRKNIVLSQEVEELRKTQEILKKKEESTLLEIERKNAELQCAILQSEQREKMMNSLCKELQNELGNADTEEETTLFQRLLALTENSLFNSKSEDFEEQFSAQFPHFLEELSRRFPTLTPIEQKVAMLLKIQLSTKDITSLLHISKRTADTHRYRIRKKIGIKDYENLAVFLNAIGEKQ